MARDPRRFRGRAQIDLSGALGGVDGGGVALDPNAIAGVAANVPYTDATFDANNVLRYKPSSPVKNFFSGGIAGATANDLNIQQQAGEIARAQALQDNATKFQQQKELQGIQQRGEEAVLSARQKGEEGLINKRMQAGVEEAKQKDAYAYDMGIRRRAAALANDDLLNANPNLTPDRLFSPQDIGELAPEYMDEANRYESMYGKGLDLGGTEGAPVEVDKSRASIRHLDAQTKAAGEKDTTRRPNIKVSADLNKFYDEDKNILTEIVPNDPLDPSKGHRVIRRDLNAIDGGEGGSGVKPPGGVKQASLGARKYTQLADSLEGMLSFGLGGSSNIRGIRPYSTPEGAVSSIAGDVPNPPYNMSIQRKMPRNLPPLSDEDLSAVLDYLNTK